MPGLKEVRTRIASVKSTQQITNAMKMVAASKFRKAQTAIIKLRPYATKLREILQNLSTSIENSEENIFAQQRKPEKVLLVVITSNRDCAVRSTPTSSRQRSDCCNRIMPTNLTMGIFDYLPSVLVLPNFSANESIRF